MRTTTYHAFALFKAHRGKVAVRAALENSEPLGFSVSASRGEKELVLSLVNPHAETDLRVQCSLSGVSAKRGNAQILHHADLNACNSFDKPNNVVPQRLPLIIDGSRVQLDLPRMSVATATLSLT